MKICVWFLDFCIKREEVFITRERKVNVCVYLCIIISILYVRASFDDTTTNRSGNLLFPFTVEETAVIKDTYIFSAQLISTCLYSSHCFSPKVRKITACQTADTVGPVHNIS